MKKSDKKNKKKITTTLYIGGDVKDSIIVQGSNNQTSFQTIDPSKMATGRFTIPYPVVDFTGRSKELDELKTSFSKGAIITGISGGGGVGKTELARKLAWELTKEYPDARLEVDLLGMSKTPLPIESAMRLLIKPLYPNTKIPSSLEELRGLYQDVFSSHKALLLLDNAADAAQVKPLIPPRPSSVIITSRQFFSLSEFGLREPLRLGVLSEDQANMLLRIAAPKLKSASNSDVGKLSNLCGYLPLALRVSAALLNDRQDWTVKSLLKHLKDEHTRLNRLKRDSDLNVKASLHLSYNLLPSNIQDFFLLASTYSFKDRWGALKSGIGGDISERQIIDLSIVKILSVGFLEFNEKDDIDYVIDNMVGKLVNRSLLNLRSSSNNKVQYFIHDLTRLYATEKLLENPAKIQKINSMNEAFKSVVNNVLTVNQRHVVMLRHFEGFSVNETSQIVGLSISQIQDYEKQGLIILREAFIKFSKEHELKIS